MLSFISFDYLNKAVQSDMENHMNKKAFLTNHQASYSTAAQS